MEALELIPNPNTLKHWIVYYTKDEYGNWQCKPRCGQSEKGRKNNEIYYSYTKAETAEEWLSALHERIIKPNCPDDSMLANHSMGLLTSFAEKNGIKHNIYFGMAVDSMLYRDDALVKQAITIKRLNTLFQGCKSFL